MLRQTPPWAGLNDAASNLLARASSLVCVPAGAAIFMQGDAPDAVYLVRSGAVAIVLHSVDGRQLVINEARPGDCFGELSALTGQPRSASAEARADSVLLRIRDAALRDALVADPELARRLLVLTATRLQASGEREGILAFMDAEARVARLLLHLDRLYERVGYITISQAELGQWAGLSRQTVAQILSRWRRRGWLTTGRGRIVLFDYVRLGQVGQQF